MSLIDDLIKNGWLKTPHIIDAFRAIKRQDFLPARSCYNVAGGPDDLKNLAEANEALPIGWEQTISQPLVVAFMLEKLQPQPGEKILDIGSGSGWTSALLAYIISQKGNPKQIQNPKSKIPKGKVIAIEIIPELMAFGKKNVAKYNFVKSGIVEFVCADGNNGYSKEAPYDKILCSASAKELPEEWQKQLKTGGRIVTPIGTSIWVFDKKSEQEFGQEEHHGFVFVPLINH